MAAKPRIQFSSDQLKHNPFGSLLSNDELSSESTIGTGDEVDITEGKEASGSDTKGPGLPFCFAGPKVKVKIVIRLERKGRGGKKATILELAHLEAKERERICTEMRSRLGCGGSVEDENVVLSGDQMDRCEVCLREYGALKIIRGN